MSKVNLKFNKIYSTPSNTLLCGELNITVPLPNSISCPPQCEYPIKDIILDGSTYKLFKDHFSRAPIYPGQFTIYDQSGFLISKYSESRTNNNSGTVDIISEPKTLLSDIIIPINDDAQTFWILTSYNGLMSRSLPEQKKHVGIHDMEILKSKYDLSNVILFITDTIYSEMSIYCNLSQIFKNVHVTSSFKLVSSFVEYIAGSIVSGSKPDFQGFLNFGSNVEVTTSYFSKIDNTIVNSNRRNGRIHITSTSTSSSSYFIILLSHITPEDIKITESTTSIDYELVETIDKSLDLSELQVSTMINSILFLDELNKFNCDQVFVGYLLKNSEKIVSYLYDSPILKVFKNNQEVTCLKLDDIINNYMVYTINSLIHSKLNFNPRINDRFYVGKHHEFIPSPIGMTRQISEY